jgi:hypothetical protein
METLVERLTRELSQVEALLKTPRSWRMYEAFGSGPWRDVTDATWSRWRQRAARLKQRLELERAAC